MGIDVAPFQDSGFVGFDQIVQGVFSSARVTHLGTECGLAFNSSEHWKCLMGEYRLRFIQSPYFLVQSQHDTYQLKNNLGESEGIPKTDAEALYDEDLAKRTLEVIESLEAIPSKVPRAFYSWSCYSHDVTESHQGFSEITVDLAQNKITTEQALQEFLDFGANTAWNSSDVLEWVDRRHSTVACPSSTVRMSWHVAVAFAA